MPSKIAGALCLLSLFAAPSQAAERRAVLVFAEHVTMGELARIPEASVGMAGATQGRYDRVQALQDVSAGARTSFAAYEPEELPPVRVVRGRVLGWAQLVRRAEAAPAEIVPGLLGETAGGAAFAGPPRAEAIAAADRAGRFDPVPSVGAGLRRHRLVVTVVRDVPALRRLLAARDADTLVLALRAPPRRADRSQLLATAMVGRGGGRALTSATTRTDGLIIATDVLPTVVRWLGEPVPGEAAGQPIRRDGALDLTELREFEARMRVVPPRRLPLLGVLGLEWLVLLGVMALAGAARRAVRIGALAVLWLLPVLLAVTAFNPSRDVEQIGVGLIALALAAATDALVRWPRAPLVPCAVAVLAHVLDLAQGSDLIVRSLFGPNPLFGARFYGIGNELEGTLPVLMLVAVAAALGDRERSRGAAIAFAAAGTALGLAIGAGRLGADVGGVITVGAGTAVAVALAAPGRLDRRRAALVVVTPFAALVALAAIDLVTGGDAHFTRSVLRADDEGALVDTIARRYELAFDNLLKPGFAVLTPVALVAIVVAVRRRNALFQGIPGAAMWQAALGGAAAAGIAGALFNDSGPLLLVFATFIAAWVVAYLRNPVVRPA